jgi:hypothetical protein
VVPAEFWWGDLKEICHLEDLDLDGRITLKRAFNRWDVAVDWIDLFEGRDNNGLLKFCNETWSCKISPKLLLS